MVQGAIDRLSYHKVLLRAGLEKQFDNNQSLNTKKNNSLMIQMKDDSSLYVYCMYIHTFSMDIAGLSPPRSTIIGVVIVPTQ